MIALGHAAARASVPPARSAAHRRRRAVRIADERSGRVLSVEAPLLELHAGGIHIEGPAWQAGQERLVFSDVPNRRLAAWYADDGRVEVLVDATWFMNGNAVAADGVVWHCEHGRRCISRSRAAIDGQPEPVVTHHEGRRLNSMRSCRT